MKSTLLASSGMLPRPPRLELRHIQTVSFTGRTGESLLESSSTSSRLGGCLDRDHPAACSGCRADTSRWAVWSFLLTRPRPQYCKQAFRASGRKAARFVEGSELRPVPIHSFPARACAVARRETAIRSSILPPGILLQEHG